MSLDYWPIVGYGVEVSFDMLDEEKIRRVFALEFDPDYPPSRDDMSDLLYMVCRPFPGLTYAGTGEMWDKPVWYVYCPVLFPWEARQEPWKSMSRERAEQIISSALAPILRIDQSSLQFTEIFDVGCG